MIEATNPFVFDIRDVNTTKLNVAAYARVSTDEDDQVNSFENQINEYKSRISENKNWTFAGMYADKGISGTQIKRRESFKKMIEDALLGKIDLILTKSISRFGRNTVELLETVRMLREQDITIYFEKENIYSNDTKLDFILTVMSSIAQEESRSISENIKWSLKKKFSEGIVTIIPSNLLGFGKGDDGKVFIIEEEAETIRFIFDCYIRGISAYDISKLLIKSNMKTIKGNLTWDSQAVLRILQNEKYAGNAILQKTYTKDYLTGKREINDNKVDKYYVENSHPAIIDKNDFKLVQEMIKQEAFLNADTPRNSKYPLTNLVYCSICKRPMKRHIHNYNRQSEKVVLNCNHAPKIKLRCEAKTIDNDLVMSAIESFTNILIDKETIQNKVLNNLSSDTDPFALTKKINEKESEIHNIKVKLESLISNYKKNLNDPHLFDLEYQKLIDKLNNENEAFENLKDKITTTTVNLNKRDLINNYVRNKFKLSSSVFIRNFIKLILVTPNQELIIILDNDDTLPSEILNDYTVLDNWDLLIDKTHYDEVLNKNVSYKVVLKNE